MILSPLAILEVLPLPQFRSMCGTHKQYTLSATGLDGLQGEIALGRPANNDTYIGQEAVKKCQETAVYSIGPKNCELALPVVYQRDLLVKNW